MFIPHYLEDIKREQFYRVPKEFMKNEMYRDQLDNNMKMMYAILRDRYELSIANRWVDSKGAVYCIYSRENLCEDLNISNKTAIKCIKKLIEMELMKEVRKGLNKPNWIYVGKAQSGSVKSSLQEVSKVHTNDTDLNETEKIKRYTITGNGDDVLNLYGDKFQERFGKEHPTVTEEQLQDIRYKLMDFDCSLSDYDEIMDDYFDNLPPTNDGKIFAFVRDGLLNSPLRRYM